MPYDANLDKKVWSDAWESETGKLTVSIYSYNNGPKKLQISRENFDAEGNTRFAKLGRLTQDEYKAILPLLTEAQNHFSDE